MNAQTNKPLISVVTPVYNQREFLRRALDSIHAQTWDGPVEIVVVDDGSTDDSADVAEAHPSEPRVIRQENTGVIGARRRGIEEANGEWIAFLDSDDRWLPEKLETQMGVLLERGVPALSFTRYRRIREDDEEVKMPVHPELDLDARARHLCYRNFVGNSTVVVHRECLERAGTYPSEEILGQGGQDYALWLRIAAFFPLEYIPTVLTEYNVHADNRVGTDPFKHMKSGLNALKNFRNWAPDRFAAMAGAPYSAVAAYRIAKFFVDSFTYRDVWPEGTARKALRSFLSSS